MSEPKWEYKTTTHGRIQFIKGDDVLDFTKVADRWKMRDRLNERDALEARLAAAEDALRAQEAWEADMILNAPDAWWDLQTREQNDALVRCQQMRNAVLAPQKQQA